MTECDTDTPIERAFPLEDAVSIARGTSLFQKWIHSLIQLFTIGFGGFSSKLLMVKGGSELVSYWPHKAKWTGK